MYSTHIPGTSSPPNQDTSAESSQGSSTANLAILPVLAILVFLTCICLKCCNWFRKSTKKDRYNDDVEEAGFVILKEGDNEYRDVEIRSESNSFYDTISSYTSFIKRSDHYDTVTSTRSLQINNPWSTCNSYRSFIQQRLGGSNYNTVNSFRYLMKHGVEMKDAAVQVDLSELNSRRIFNKRRSDGCISRTSQRSFDASSTNGGDTHSQTDSRDQSKRHFQRHRVSFVDHTRRHNINTNASSSDKSEGLVSKSCTDSQSSSGIRDSHKANSHNFDLRYSPLGDLGCDRHHVNQHKINSATSTESQDDLRNKPKGPPHRFKVYKTDEKSLDINCKTKHGIGNCNTDDKKYSVDHKSDVPMLNEIPDAHFYNNFHHSLERIDEIRSKQEHVTATDKASSNAQLEIDTLSSVTESEQTSANILSVEHSDVVGLEPSVDNGYVSNSDDTGSDSKDFPKSTLV